MSECSCPSTRRLPRGPAPQVGRHRSRFARSRTTPVDDRQTRRSGHHAVTAVTLLPIFEKPPVDTKYSPIVAHLPSFLRKGRMTPVMVVCRCQTFRYPYVSDCYRGDANAPWARMTSDGKNRCSLWWRWPVHSNLSGATWISVVGSTKVLRVYACGVERLRQNGVFTRHAAVTFVGVARKRFASFIQPTHITKRCFCSTCSSAMS